MFARIDALKKKGYAPTHVFDIGAYHGHWTTQCSAIFPEAHFFMFEAIQYDELNRFRGFSNVHVFNELLNDKVENVVWNEMRNTGDSMFKEKTLHFNNCNQLTRQTTTLNKCLADSNISFNGDEQIFIKVDCQGAELPIIKGASDLLSRTDFIILEMPLFGQYNEGVPTFLEHIQYMDSIGFVPYDIIERHYINNFNMQVDIMFINREHPLNVIVQEQLNYVTQEQTD